MKPKSYRKSVAQNRVGVSGRQSGNRSWHSSDNDDAALTIVKVTDVMGSAQRLPEGYIRPYSQN
jgi:hypothetical protein